MKANKNCEGTWGRNPRVLCENIQGDGLDAADPLLARWPSNRSQSLGLLPLGSPKIGRL